MPASTHSYCSYVAIGDSFTEGLGDERPDGSQRGWADLVAAALAASASGPVTYANLAIRGRLLAPIIAEQLGVAIDMAPALMSLNGGGNDILRPRVSIASVADRIEAAVDRATDAGIHVLLVSGGNPSQHIPFGGRIGARGELLADAIRSRLPKENVTWVDNWADEKLQHLRYWSTDKLHLNSRGHERVAANILAALGVPVPTLVTHTAPSRPATAEYWREYVLPWIGRRLTGRSSGDGRTPKIPSLQPVPAPQS